MLAVTPLAPWLSSSHTVRVSTQGPSPGCNICLYKALLHRLDIERRITEAGFEIAKERQMMFRENDRDVEDLFGAKDAFSLAE